VIANHMLYHLPDPSRGVGELARVTAPSGQVVVATNGRGHMRELWEIRSEVFGIERVDHTIDVFGVDLQRHRLLCLHRTQEQLADSCSSAGSAAEDHHQGHSSASV